MVLVACKHEKVKTECYMFDESAVSERKLSDESREKPHGRSECLSQGLEVNIV